MEPPQTYQNYYQPESSVNATAGSVHDDSRRNSGNAYSHSESYQPQYETVEQQYQPDSQSNAYYMPSQVRCLQDVEIFIEIDQYLLILRAIINTLLKRHPNQFPSPLLNQIFNHHYQRSKKRYFDYAKQ